MRSEKHFDLIVIGAGAAGLIAAGTAAQYGKKIALIERNQKPGRKVMITGKGRCNVTNNCEPDVFFRNVRRNAKFLYSAVHRFTPADTMVLFESLGVPLKTERGGRVFPASDRAADIVDALKTYASKKNIDFISTRAKKIITENEKLTGVLCDDGRQIFAPKMIVCTGGKSYPATGSSGDGYHLAESVGHSIQAVRPSLVPVVMKESWCKDCMGLSLRNVQLSLFANGQKKPLYSELSEMLFTHFGASGPLVLTASSFLEEPFECYEIRIDLKPGLHEQQLSERILRDFSQNSNRNFANALGALLPQKIISTIVKLSGIDPEKKVHQVTKEERESLVHLLKNLPMTPEKLLPIDEAIVTAGGVNVSEIDPRTMQSKLVHGLYFAGEVLDVDAWTGGFNLQIAFSTGFLAGESAGKEQEL